MKYCAAVSDVQNVGVGQKLTGQRDEQVSASARISIHDFLARASAAQTESDIFAVLWGGSRESAADVLPALLAGVLPTGRAQPKDRHSWFPEHK